MINKDFASKKESVMVAPYALYDVLHAFHVNNVECTVGKEDGSLVVYFMKIPERHDDGKCEALIEDRDKRIAELENTVKDDRQKAAELIGHWISLALKRSDEIKKLNKSIQDLDVAKRSAEVVFQSLLDAGLIKEWYFNGQFQALLKSDDPHVELAHLKDEIKKKDEEIMALKKVIEMADAQYFKMRNSYEKEALENQKCLRGIK